MRRTTPTVRQGLLTLPGAQQDTLILVGTAAWHTWLETATLFFFVSAAGTFTARKERWQRGSWYWKAYRTHQGKLSRIYLGKTAHLTQDGLELAAQKLAQRSTSRKSTTEYQQPPANVPDDGATASDTLLPTEQPGHAPSAGQPAPEPLLAIKIVVPPLRPGLVLRTRLAAMLAEARDRQLMVISAPAGYGKTTLLTQWSAQSPWQVAWVSLEASESDPQRFWRYLITALEKLTPRIIGREVLELGQSRPAPPLESVVTTLLNALLLLQEDVALILDDYHLITDQSTHDSLAFFLDHLPPKLHLVLASRTDPPLPLARLRARQQLFELRASDLRFTPEEVTAFLTADKSLHLSDEQMATLAASTEGWIAALHLAALSLQGCKDIPGFLHAFAAGAHRSLADYLAEEVLQQQPKALQTFLMQTALLDRLSGPLCEAMLGDEQEVPGERLQSADAPAQALLERLEQENLFLLPLDAERRWYRYHHLFAEFLRERLRRTSPQQIPVLHQRAAAWYEGQGLLADAIHHALAAGEFSQAARLICQIGEMLVNRSEVALLRRWLEALPETLARSHPQLCLLRAWAFATMGQFEPAEDWLHAAECCLDELVQEAPAAWAARLFAPGPLSEVEGRAMLQSLAGEIAALRAHSAAFWGNIPESQRFAQQALEQLPQERSFLRGLSALNLGIACWLSGDVLSATQTLSQARALGLAINNSYVALLATCGLAQVHMVQGKRRLAFKTGQEALRLASEEGGNALPAAAYAYVGMGQMCYEWNDLNAASYYLEEGIALSERWGNGDMVVYGYTVLAQVKQAQQDTFGALEMIEQAERYVQSYQQRPWIIAIMVAQQVRLALMQGNLEAISRWTQQAEQDYVVTFEEVTRARIHLAQRQPDRALSLLEGQAHQAASSGRIGTLLEIRLLQAQAYQQQGALEQAIQVLEEALTLAEPEGYLRLFIDEGAPMQSLLAMWLRWHQHQATPADQRLVGYVKKVLGVFSATLREDAHHAERRRPEHMPALRSTFSQREQEILRHLAAGQSNEAIAAALVLEVSTVKWHLTRIYGKLQVQNRTQAVLQAKMNQLL